MTVTIDVVRAGPLVTVQDDGRPGAMRFGVPRSGPMDRLAHAAANVAVGNPAAAAALEVSRGGVGLRPDGELLAAVVGDGFDATVDGVAHPAWTVLRLRPGQQMDVAPSAPSTPGTGRATQQGAWAVVAVQGGLSATSWLGSSSTHATSGLGGGVVVTGDELHVGACGQIDLERLGPIPRPEAATTPALERGRVDVLRVVVGPQHRRLADEAVDVLLNSTWTASHDADRMGTRLDGPGLALGDALSIPSSAVVRGSVQVAGDGVPTLLHADHQTTGGYPRIATVVDADLDRAAQLTPGSQLRFEALMAPEAIDLARRHAEQRAAYLDLVAGPARTMTHRLRGANLVGGVVRG